MNAKADLQPGGEPEEFSPDASNTRALRDALGCFATGVTIVTAHSSGGPVGMTVNSFASVSLDPPLILWSVARSAGCCEAFETSAWFSVNVLRECHAWLALQFAHDATSFDKSLWATAANGLPVLRESLVRFDCTRECLHPGGDHTIIIGRVQQVSMRQGAPLLFCKGAFGSVPFVRPLSAEME